MADLPSSVYDPQPMPPTPEEQSGLHAQWTQFLANPDNRAALFQAGVALLQPIGVGQSVGGHIANAIGMAGETVGERQTQRNQMANESLARQLAVGNFDLSGKRLDLESQQEQRLGRSSDIAAKQGERGLDIAQQNADSATTRSNRQPGVTPNRLTEMRGQALKVFLDPMGDWKTSGVFSSPDLTYPQFLKEYLQVNGVDPALVGGASLDTGAPLNAAPQPGDLTATPKGTPASVSPVEGQPGYKPSANQFLLSHDAQWKRLQVNIQSPDPQVKQQAQLAYQVMQGMVRDPENLPLTRPPMSTVVGDPAAAPQAVPAVPAPPPIAPNPTPWGGGLGGAVPYLPKF